MEVAKLQLLMDHLENVKVLVFRQNFMENVMVFQTYALLAPVLNNNVDLHVKKALEMYKK